MKLENRKKEHRFKEPYSWKTKIPKRWQLVPNRGLFTERNVKNCPDYQPLTVTIKSGVSRQADYLETSTKKDNSNENKDNYKLVRPGDLAYNKMRMWQGAVGVSNYEGIVSPAYIVIRPKVNLVSKFFHYLFRTKEYTVESYRHSYGISSDQLSLRFEDFKTILTPLPPLQEQQAIVRFLDQKLAKIDEYIRKKERMIELLKEQKTSLINEAVTQGLDPDVPTKDSGIDWLGEIPENWEVKKIKHLGAINPSKNSPHINSSSRVTFLPMERVTSNGEIDQSEMRDVLEVWSGYAYFERGDLIIAKITPCFENGKGAHLKNLNTNYGFGSSEFIVIRPFKNIKPEYLYYITVCAAFRKQGKKEMTGSAGQQRVPTSFIRNWELGIPPLSEQISIVEYLNQKNRRFNSLINSIYSQITKMKEYRQSLISEAVTGKIDCREYMPEQTANAVV